LQFTATTATFTGALAVAGATTFSNAVTINGQLVTKQPATTVAFAEGTAAPTILSQEDIATQLLFNSVLASKTYGLFNITTSKFTAPVTGVYLVSCQWTCSGAAYNPRLYQTRVMSGVNILAAQRGQSITTLVSLSIGTEFWVSVVQTTGVSTTLDLGIGGFLGVPYTPTTTATVVLL
jgi:hypothetical protein